MESEDYGFFDYSYSLFDEYLEAKRVNSLKKNKEYNDLRKKEAEIKQRYPNIIHFIDDRDTISNITKEEQTAILEILEIKEQIFNLEKKEIFKMGMKEMINLL